MTLDTHKLARLGLFTALASILGYIESLRPFFRASQVLSLALQSRCPLSFASLYMERGCRSIGSPHFDHRFSVWKFIWNYLQLFRCRTQSVCHDILPEKNGCLSRYAQHSRRCFSQCRAACCCDGDRRKFCTDLLCARAACRRGRNRRGGRHYHFRSVTPDLTVAKTQKRGL